MERRWGNSGSIIRGGWSLADKSVLFMDEWQEFSHDALEAYRVPMETGSIYLARVSGSNVLRAGAPN